MSCDYSNALQAHSSDPNNPRIDAHIKFLEEYFGKHNLTATEEEKPFLEIKDADAEFICRVGENPILSVKAPIDEPKPKVKVGDIVKVSQDMDWGSETFKDAKTCFCNTPSEIVEIKNDYATIKAIVNGVFAVIPLKELIPYTEEQEQVDGRQEVVDMTLKTWLNSTPDWLAYRMELAKEISSKLIVALSDGGLSSDYCQSVIDETVTIVNGIVERLKGGHK